MVWVKCAEACERYALTPSQLRSRRLKGTVKHRRLQNGRYEYEVPAANHDTALPLYSALALCTQHMPLTSLGASWLTRWHSSPWEQAHEPLAPDLPIWTEIGIVTRENARQCGMLATGRFSSVVPKDVLDSFAMIHVTTFATFVLYGASLFGANNVSACLFVLAFTYKVKTGIDAATLYHIASCLQFTTLWSPVALALRMPPASALALACLYTFTCCVHLLLRHKTRSMDPTRFFVSTLLFSVGLQAITFQKVCKTRCIL